MPVIDRIHGVTDPSQETVIVLPELLHVMHASGISHAADGRKLSNDQLDTMMAGKPIQERIRIKLLAQRSGVYPDPEF